MRAVEDYRRRTQQWESIQLKLDDANPDGKVMDEKRKTTLQWDNPYYQAELRRDRVSKAFIKDEENGTRLGNDSPRPKTGWV